MSINEQEQQEQQAPEQPQEPQPLEQVPAPEPIKYYEVDREDLQRVSLTCNNCRMSLDFRISKTRTVRLCPCCSKPAEVKEIS